MATCVKASIEDMYARKMGALIRASVLMAAECAPELESRYLVALNRFAAAIGLAFQIQDDLLDLAQDVATLGKSAGLDRERAKATYPGIIGTPASRQRVHLLHLEARDALMPFGERAAPLHLLAQWLFSRRH